MRIEEYNIDNTPHFDDIVIGTDGLTKQTKNFRLKDIVTLLSVISGMSGKNQGLKNYIYSSDFSHYRTGRLQPSGWLFLTHTSDGWEGTNEWEVIKDEESQDKCLKVNIYESSGRAARVSLNERLVINQDYSFYTLIKVEKPLIITIKLNEQLVAEEFISESNKWHAIRGIINNEDGEKPHFSLGTINFHYAKNTGDNSIQILRPTLTKSSIFTDWVESFTDLKYKIVPRYKSRLDVLDEVVSEIRSVGDTLMIIDDDNQPEEYIFSGGIDDVNLIRKYPKHFGKIAKKTDIPFNNLIRGDRMVIIEEIVDFPKGAYFHDGVNWQLESIGGSTIINEGDTIIQGGDVAMSGDISQL